MEITFEQFRDRFRSTSNSMLSDYDCEYVKTDEDRMMIVVFGEMLDEVWRSDKMMEMCYKEYLSNRDFINK